MGRKALQLPDKTCPVCGKVFNRNRFNGILEDSTRYNSRQTCSQSCGNSLENPTDRTSFHLRAQKFKKPTCETCGSDQNLDAHHKDGDITNNMPKNIQTLCHSCHMKLHWQRRKSSRDMEKTELQD